MIDFGTITINESSTLVTSRNKILALASDLQFDEIGATRIATITSELIRLMIQTGEDGKVNVELVHKGNALGLCLQFHAKDVRSALKHTPVYKVFDHVDLCTAEDGSEFISAFKALPWPKFKASDDFVAAEKEKVERLSEEELYDKLKDAFDSLKSQSAQLIQTEKMSAVGTMAAGVAHELNNPMMGILNYIQYCKKHTDAEDRRFGVLEDAEKEVKRCTDIVMNLLTFSRMEDEGDEGRTEASMIEILERVLKLVAYRLTEKNVTIKKSCAKDTPMLWVKANTIQQVFLNLVNNALDAMGDRDNQEIRVKVAVEDKCLVVAITDTAGGIPDEVMKKIFEPFFTTKPTGQGTGLGLSISRSIIEQHGGEMLCDSIVDQGTTFTIRLPINLRRGDE